MIANVVFHRSLTDAYIDTPTRQSLPGATVLTAHQRSIVLKGPVHLVSIVLGGSGTVSIIPL